MPTLELAISAIGMLAGATVATGALDRVSRSSLVTANNVWHAQRALDRLGYSARGFGSVLNRALGAFGVYRALQFGISTLGEFDKQFQTLKATLGDNAASSALQALIVQATQLGSTGQYTTSQVVSAMVELAKAGFDVKKTFATIGPVLDLAVAGELSLKDAAELMVNSLNQFSLGADKAGHVVDVLTKASLDATTDIHQLGDALKYAGPFASITGVSFEEASATLALLSNNAIKASMGGTNLRGVLASLIAPTKQGRLAIQAASDAMKKQWNDAVIAGSDAVKEMGLQVKDLDVTTIGFTKALENLKKANPSAGQLKLLFGRLNVSGGVSIIKYLDAIKLETAALKDADGVARSYASTIAESLPVALMKLKASIEASIVSWGSGAVIDGIKVFITAVSDGIKWAFGLRDAIAGNATVAEYLGRGLRAVGAILLTVFAVHTVSTILAVAGAFTRVYESLKLISTVLFGMTGMLGAVVSIIALAAAAIAIYWDRVVQVGDETTTLGDITVATISYIAERFKFLADFIWRAFTFVWKQLPSYVASILNDLGVTNSKAVQGLINIWMNFRDGFGDIIKSVVNFGIALFKTFIESVRNMIGNVVLAFQNFYTNFSLKDPLKAFKEFGAGITAFDVFANFTDRLSDNYKNYLGEWGQFGHKAAEIFWEGLSEEDKDQWKKFNIDLAIDEIKRRAVARTKTKLSDHTDMQSILDQLKALPPQSLPGMEPLKPNEYTDPLGGKQNHALERLEEYVSKLEFEGQEILKLDRIKQADEQIRETERLGLEANVEALDKYIERVKAAQEQIQKGEAIKKMVDGLADAFGDAAEQIAMDFSKMSEAFKSAFNAIRQVVIHQLLTEPLKQGLSSLFRSGLSAIGYGGVSFGGASYNGNVFHRGGIVPHAFGGIVDRETLFPMSGGRIGSMGERGPEAIMPLDRIGGKLGVRAHGMGNTIVHNWYITTNDAASFKKSKRQIMDDMNRYSGR